MKTPLTHRRLDIFPGLVLVILALHLATNYCAAMTTVTVSPTTSTYGDVATPVTVQADTAASGNQLVFDVYIDVDRDGTLDPEDGRFMSFAVADGQTAHLGNSWFWHDEDGSENSSVKATLISNGFWLFSGAFVVKVIDEDLSTRTASFTLEQDASFPCVVTGQVQLGGSPAGGAIVQAMDLAAEATVAMTVANADGTFQLRIKSPGSYGIIPYQPGAVTKFGPGSGQMLEVSEGTNSLSAPLVLFPGTRTISGRLLASDTSEGLRGTLLIAGAGDGEELVSLATTGDDGSYTLNVMDGEWEISPYEGLSRLGYLKQYSWVSVSGGNAMGVDLSCPRATTLIRGTVKDAGTGEALQGYEVWAELESNGLESMGCSGPDGSYAIGVVEADWNVYVDEDSLVGTDYAAPSSRNVSAPASGTVSGINFALQKAGKITGHVYESDGVTPVARASIDVHDSVTSIWVTWRETAQDGSYSVTVPSGTYTLHVYGVEGWADQFSSAVTVTAPYETGGVNFILQPGATIRGHVWQDDGVTPIDNAWVEVLHATSGEMIAGNGTESDGSYFTSVPSGSYKIEVYADGWLSQYYDNAYTLGQATTITVTVPEERPGIDFVLQPPGATGKISGHVYEQGGVTPMAGARVEALDSWDGHIVAGDDTDAQGFYSISVPTGSYKVKAEADGWLAQYYFQAPDFNQATTITVTAPEERTGIDFVLLKASTIKGHVYRQDGVTPLPGASVGAQDVATFVWMAWAQTDNDGTYTLQVPPGTFWFEASGWRCSSQYYDHTDYWNATPVIVSEGAVVDNIDFSLEFTPLGIEALSWSTVWARGLDLRWQPWGSATYRVFWSPGPLGQGMNWYEVPNAQDEFRQEGNTLIWTDRGAAPGMNAKRPGDPDVRKRFHRIEEVSD